jgi:hypothetical protein
MRASRLALAVICLALGTSALAESYPVPVVVKNTDPVPTAAVGTTLVAGTVAVEGTPSVNVVALPEVTLAPGSTVRIDASSPLSLNVNETARQAVMFYDEIVLAAGSFGAYSPDAFTVPPGKRLVIENIAGYAFLQAGQNAIVTVHTFTSNGGFFHALPLVHAGNFSALFSRPEAFTVNQSLRLFSDPTAPVGLSFQRSETTGTALLQVSFTGYLVDL